MPVGFSVADYQANDMTTKPTPKAVIAKVTAVFDAVFAKRATVFEVIVGHSRRGVAIIAFVACHVGYVERTNAQATAAFSSSTDEGNDKSKFPFVLPTQAQEILESMEDFQRYAKREKWDQSFSALKEIAKAGSDKMLPHTDGVMLPPGRMVRRILAGLSSSGKTAYRLFYDAEAQRLLNEAKDDNELENLQKLTDLYLLTSVGDASANRLAETHFEQGEMDAAISVWRDLLEFRADSRIPRHELLLKVGIALVRSERWSEAQEVMSELQDRHAGEAVTLGGRKVKCDQHLHALLADPPDRAHPTSIAQNLKLPESVEPLWQFRYLIATQCDRIDWLHWTRNDWRCYGNDPSLGRRC